MEDDPSSPPEEKEEAGCEGPLQGGCRAGVGMVRRSSARNSEVRGAWVGGGAHARTTRGMAAISRKS